MKSVVHILSWKFLRDSRVEISSMQKIRDLCWGAFSAPYFDLEKKIQLQLPAFTRLRSIK